MAQETTREAVAQAIRDNPGITLSGLWEKGLGDFGDLALALVELNRDERVEKWINGDGFAAYRTKG
jgi:hypothetical protein